MKYLILGRSGTGKDYLQHKLEQKGFKSVLSYTTRPRRTPDERTHVFISTEDAALFEKQKVASAILNGYEYFATRSQLEEQDTYIINPDGLYMLLSNMPDTDFSIVYVYTTNKDKSIQAILDRSDNEDELNIHTNRLNDEHNQFSEFEQIIVSDELIAKKLPKNVKQILTVRNDFNETDFDKIVSILAH